MTAQEQEVIYTPARRDGTWVVLRDGHAIVGRYPSGPAGAEAAAQAAQSLNRTEIARRMREARAVNRVRTWRAAHGLSQAALAQHLGVQVFTLQRWEYGSSEPPLYLQLALERLDQILQ